MEEAKSQENAKLQAALQDMQHKFNETKEMLKKERETAKKAAEQVPVIQEVPVIDHELMNKITAENEKLKVWGPKFYYLLFYTFYSMYIVHVFSFKSQALVSSLEKKIDDTEKKYEETNKLSEERLKQTMDAESKIVHLKTAMQRYSDILNYL